MNSLNRSAITISFVQLFVIIAAIAASAMMATGIYLDVKRGSQINERYATGRADLCYRISKGTWIPARLEMQLRTACDRQQDDSEWREPNE